MSLRLQSQNDLVSNFIHLIKSDNDLKANYYFAICGRAFLYGFNAKIFLHGSFITEDQKVKYKRIPEANGEIARGHWTIVLKFTDENWKKFVIKTAETEVVFECLLKKPARDPSFIGICSFPTIGKEKSYVIIIIYFLFIYLILKEFRTKLINGSH